MFKSWRLGVSIPRPLRTYSIVTRVASTEALSVRALAFCGAFLSCLALAQARNISAEITLNSLGNIGGRSRTRTYDPLIKSYRNTVFTV